MAEEIWTGLEIGPFEQSKFDDVMEVVKSIIIEYGSENDPEVASRDDGTYVTLLLGHQNYGAGNMFAHPGRIEELMEIEVPYALYDDGKSGVGLGSDYSWHPSYGEFVKHRERNIDSELTLSLSRMKLMGPVSNEELGKAVRAYFSEPGDPEAADGWAIWEDDYERPAERLQRFYEKQGHNKGSLTEEDRFDEDLRTQVLEAATAKEPAVHLIGNIESGYSAYGPYKSRDVAADRHEPELEELLTVFDHPSRTEDCLGADDIDKHHFGAIWVSGNLTEGHSARGIYRNAETAVEANDGKDGFVVCLIGPLQ